MIDKNYYPQVFLEKYKYVPKAKRISKIIIVDIEISSDDSYNEKSDEENSDDFIENILAEQTRCINLF